MKTCDKCGEMRAFGLDETHRRAIVDIALETFEQVYGWRREDPLQVTTHLDW